MSASLMASLLGLALVDSLNPSLFVSQLYLLTTPRPLRRMLAYIVGVVVVNLAVGIAVLVGFHTVVMRLIAQVPPHIFWYGELVLGIVLLGAGLWIGRRGQGQPAERRPRSLAPRHTFILGMAITLQEVSTAVPYLVAIDQLATRQLAMLTNVLLLCLYNAIYIAPLLGVITVFVAYGERHIHRLTAINEVIGRWLPRILQVVVFSLGAFFVLDALVALIN